MADAKFTHLHVHTHYSLLDGANKIPDLVKRAKSLGMDSLAITDHGCMFGVVEFFNECKKEGIKPILGMEAYMAPGDRRDRSGTPGETAYHLLLLAQNLEGYHNLLKLSSTAYRDGFYYKPRIDKDVLREHHRGLIATSACLGGEIPSAFMRRGKMAEAKRTAETYLEIFGPDRFFIEVQNHIKEQNEVNPELEQLAKTCGIGLVATNDVHFLTADDHRVHDVLCCISMGKLQSDESRLKYPKELYLKSPDEMVTALGNYDQAIENTSRIAAMCDLSLDFSKRFAPVYKVEPAVLSDVIPPGLPAATLKPIPPGEPVPVMKDDERYLRQLCEEGLIWRYGTRDVPSAERQRLEYEITVIAAKSFCSYFLIVWDFCNYARDNGIPVGARGSGVGSMVAFLLGLCNVDPIKYNLLFERFMDPSRNEMPDIDIDICQDGRQRVIEYVRQKYGHVAQIITFGTLAAKAACKDVGRVLGVPLAEIDKLTKLIPPTPGMTLKKAIDAVPELDGFIKSSPMIANVIEYAKKLEGMARNAGCHAAGVIIADQPLDGIVPLYRDSDGNVLTQFEGPVAEKCGLLKMDFLGLRTLTALTRSIDLERATRDVRPVKWIDGQPVPEFDKDGRYEVDKIDLADPRVYQLFQRGETRAVFQFESGGMQDLLIKMVPDRIGDLIAANALYRPGPMELIPTYCARKHGKEAVPQVHPIMDAILAETYGIMVYQEQVMQIFNQLGGIELSNAYKLIKAISKKNTDIIAKFKPDFLKGTMDKGVSKDKAEEIFDFILKFGGYGFNKCVVGDTVVVDATSGRRATVNELFHENRGVKGKPSFTVHALGEDGKLRPRAVTDVMFNGRKRVYELVTAQGKRLTATDNHPFRTLDGWTNLGELKVGDRIAAARRLDVATTATMPRHEVIVLAGLLSEGNTCHPSCLYFFGNDRALVDDFAAAAGAFPETVARTYARPDGRRLEVCLSTGRDARFRPGHRNGGVATSIAPSRSGAFRWAEALGIVGLKATEKHVPAAVFELCDADVALFLGRLWAGDGFLANATQAVPFYATSSVQLARDVQTLLLRLGIVSGVHAKRFKYRGGERPGYTVHLLGDGSICTFIDRVTPHCLGREVAVAKLVAYVASVDPDRSSKDTVPPEVRAWVDAERRAAGLTWREVEDQSGVCVKELYYVNPAKSGFRRSTVAKLGEFFGSARLSTAAASDVFWDRVVSIEPKGVQDTYDLTVDVDHNFVADGLVIHNSHSARYAIVAYQTAYMKTYHPVEYMSAVLTFEMGTTEKVVEYIDECRRMTLADGGKGIKVLPPDVNVSAKDFTPVYTAVEEKGRGKRGKTKVEGTIRFGLAAVRGVGEKAVEAIAAERAAKGNYPNLYDFCERVDLRTVPKATIEALAKCGAFASTGANRAQLMQVAAAAFESGQQTQADRRNGQMSMFGGPAAPSGPSAAAVMGGALPNVEEFENAELLKFEKELLGFYITSHPLTDQQVTIERFTTASTKEAMAMSEGTEVTIGGMISRSSKKVAKSGRSAGMPWAILTIEDLDGTIDGMCFAEAYAEITAKYPDAVTVDKIVFVRGKVDKKRETPNLMVSEIIPVADAVAKLTTAVCVKLDSARHDPSLLADLPGMLAKHKGVTPVYFQVATAQGKAMLSVDKQHGVKPSQLMVDDIEHVLGHGSVDLAGAGAKRRKRLEQQRLFKEDAVEAEVLPATATAEAMVAEAELDEAI